NINIENDWQTIVYLYSIYNLLKFHKKIDNPNQLSFTYFFLKENINMTIKFSNKKYTEYQKKLNNICNKILEYSQNNY
ncbi:hypothetical protein IJG14_03515, partial [bacterium]|nr:hypothetical protein [bacterium]